MREMMMAHLAADDNGAYHFVSGGTKGKNSEKHGAQQGEQTQDKDKWDECIDAIMATVFYKSGPIGRERLEQKMREHVGYNREEYGPDRPNIPVQHATKKRKAAEEALEQAKKIKEDGNFYFLLY